MYNDSINEESQLLLTTENLIYVSVFHLVMDKYLADEGGLLRNNTSEKSIYLIRIIIIHEGSPNSTLCYSYNLLYLTRFKEDLALTAIFLLKESPL